MSMKKSIKFRNLNEFKSCQEKISLTHMKVSITNEQHHLNDSPSKKLNPKE